MDAPLQLEPTNDHPSYLGSHETVTFRFVLCHRFGIGTNCHHDIISSTFFQLDMVYSKRL